MPRRKQPRRPTRSRIVFHQDFSGGVGRCHWRAHAISWRQHRLSVTRTSGGFPCDTVALVKDVNLIVRLIAPLISQPPLTDGGVAASGIGDITTSFFIGPAHSTTDQKWTVPINVVVAKLSSFGPFPGSYQLGFGAFPVHPDAGPSWKIRGTIVVLLPRTRS